jgi:hypothetical protein
MYHLLLLSNCVVLCVWRKIAICVLRLIGTEKLKTWCCFPPSSFPRRVSPYNILCVLRDVGVVD